MDLAEWYAIGPYSQSRDVKAAVLSKALLDLTSHHIERCESYRRILDAVGFDPAEATSYLDIPSLPVRLFKELDLRSVDADAVVKTMTSSGTSGQSVSRIYLDKETAANQTKVLTRLVSDVIGAQRLPMIVIDSPAVVKDRAMFSARGAGILGFSIFGRDRIFALDDEMRLDLEAVSSFLDKHAGERILLFGFTFMVWQHFYSELARSGATLDLGCGVLVHGGGWKKLTSEAVSSTVFRERLHDVCGLRSIHDYYGMVEQTGSIYLECDQGHLHASIYSDVVVRRPSDFSPAVVGEPGLIEVVSVLPSSYPGHVLLTEDEGVVLGEDDCPCGRLGKYFKVLGRIKDAELRGCSDTYGAEALTGGLRR
jgi:phenylacetate-coenzyme A ligase PaaK-like adenylate-forming protein